MIKWLNAQLERERLEHTAAIELMAQQWQQEMRKAVEDYGRMKVGRESRGDEAKRLAMLWVWLDKCAGVWCHIE